MPREGGGEGGPPPPAAAWRQEEQELTHKVRSGYARSYCTVPYCTLSYCTLRYCTVCYDIVHYFMTSEKSSTNIAFGSVNIQRYYTVEQLIAQLRQCGETTVKCGRINGGKLILSLIYFVV